MTAPDPTRQIWWLVSRASGSVALVLVTASVVLGLSMAGRVLRGRVPARTLTSLHEQLAVTGLVAIAVHVIALLGDAYLHPTLAQVLIPFRLGYRAAFTGLGAIAAYLATLLGLSFYARKRIGPKRWRSAHRATIVVWALGMVHAIGAGTDATSAWLRWFMIAGGALVVALFVNRVRGGGRPPARRVPVVSGE